MNNAVSGSSKEFPNVHGPLLFGLLKRYLWYSERPRVEFADLVNHKAIFFPKFDIDDSRTISICRQDYMSKLSTYNPVDL